MMQNVDNIQEEIQRRNELTRQTQYEIAKISAEFLTRFMKKVWGNPSTRLRLSMNSSHKTIGTVEYNELCMPWMKRKNFTNTCDYPVTITIGGQVATIQPGETVEL